MDPHQFFGGVLGVKKGVPNGPFSATKSLVYCFVLPLVHSRLKNSIPDGDLEIFESLGEVS